MSCLMRTRKKYQECIGLLLEIHESDDSLEEMRDVVGGTNRCKCQGEVANVVRYLMHLRDKAEKDGEG